MKEWRTGNVVRLKTKNLVIITDVRENTTSWVSFDSENCSGVSQNKTETKPRPCGCNYGVPGNFDCEQCRGTGTYQETVYGMNDAKVLADCVKDYIQKRLLKNFDD